VATWDRGMEVDRHATRVLSEKDVLFSFDERKRGRREDKRRETSSWHRDDRMRGPEGDELVR